MGKLWLKANPEIVLLLIGTIGGIVSTWLQRNGKKTEARLVDILTDAIQDAGGTEVKDRVAGKADAAKLSGILDARLVKKGYKGP